MTIREAEFVALRQTIAARGTVRAADGQEVDRVRATHAVVEHLSAEVAATDHLISGLNAGQIVAVAERAARKKKPKKRV